MITVRFDAAGWWPNFTQKYYGAFDIPDLCVVPVLKDDIGLNTLAAMFLASYTFGMMARYYPTAWISLARVQKGDRILPMVTKPMKFIEDKFPDVVLEHLRAPYDFEKTKLTNHDNANGS